MWDFVFLSDTSPSYMYLVLWILCFLSLLKSCIYFPDRNFWNALWGQFSRPTKMVQKKENNATDLFCHIFSTTLNTFVLCWTSTLVVLAQTDARAVLKLSRSLCGAPAVTSQEMGKWGCWALERKAFGDVCSTTSHSAVLKPSITGNAEPFSCRVLALIKAWEIFFMSQQRLVMFDTCRRNRCRK